MTTNALVIGAGALGLGFLAERMAGDYQLYLADTTSQAERLKLIQKNQGYTVNICGANGITTKKIAGDFKTMLTDTNKGQKQLSHALQTCPLVFTATDRSILDSIVKSIASVLNNSKEKKWLLFCENGLNISSYYAACFNPNIILVDTVMSRMCRLTTMEEENYYQPLGPGCATALAVEEYHLIPLPADRCAMGPFTSSFTMVTNDEFRCWEDIKLYMHNGIHAFISYHAFLEGVKYFPDTPSTIRAEARQAILKELVPAIMHNHPTSKKKQLEEYGLDLLDRFFNPYFHDSIERGVRGVAEKLRPEERLYSGCKFIKKAGIEPVIYASTIEAAQKIVEKNNDCTSSVKVRQR